MSWLAVVNTTCCLVSHFFKAKFSCWACTVTQFSACEDILAISRFLTTKKATLPNRTGIHKAAGLG